VSRKTPTAQPPVRPSTPDRSQDGRAGNSATEPAPGWKGRSTRTLFTNARVPSVPATLDISLHEYYAAAALMGLIASQHDEPNQKWACQWSFEMGQRMAHEAVKHRRTRKR
jgi:hypothetical protein